MDKQLEQRITTQAALCVEELLETTEKNAKRIPWEVIIERRMRSLFLAKDFELQPNIFAKRDR
jgi:hypothetical protein